MDDYAALRATKCVIQSFDGEGLRGLLTDCLILTYNAIKYAKENGIYNRKGMKSFYRSLKGEAIPSCYKKAAIGRACQVVASRMKTEIRGNETRFPKPLKPAICLISAFFLTVKGRLFIPLRRDRYFDVQLNRHVLKTLKGKKIRSLTITPDHLSFCYSEDIEPEAVGAIYGVDRNEKNITFGDERGIYQIDMKEVVRIRQTTREITSSFRRNDMRVGKALARKYWSRSKHRTDQILHAATNFLVDIASRNCAALALENLADIRKKYRKGNGQGTDYRFRLNSWPHGKAKRMIEYKALWKGVSLIELTKSDTYGSSSECSACGEKLHSPAKDDAKHERMLWCRTCKVWIDRDANAALNLSIRGLARFASSHPKSRSRSQETGSSVREKGRANEALRGNGIRRALILGVDASKLVSGGHSMDKEIERRQRPTGPLPRMC